MSINIFTLFCLQLHRIHQTCSERKGKEAAIARSLLFQGKGNGECARSATFSSLSLSF